MIFNFFSATVNTDKRPTCPRCKKTKLARQMSLFSSPKGLSEEDDMPMPDLDESKMTQAMNMLAQEAEGLNENDPRQAANLMRKLTGMTGLELGSGMEEALRRMEAGEDPEEVEHEMGDLLEEDEPFSFKKRASRAPKRRPPGVDARLYDL